MRVRRHGVAGHVKMKGMKSTELIIEPGVLRVFNTVLVLRLLVSLLSLLVLLAPRPDVFPRFPVIGVLDSLVLLAYLHWGALARKMGRWHLPPALLLLTLTPGLEAAVTNWLRTQAGTVLAIGQYAGWATILVLLVPVVLASWQYGLRGGVAVVAISATWEAGLAVLSRVVGGPAVLTVLATVLVRTFLYAAVVYLVAELGKAQRQQRAALADANVKLARYAATVAQLSVSQERNRMARELHDTLAHSLSAVSVQLEAAEALINSARVDDGRTMLGQAQATARQGLGEARRAILALRASPLEDLGLAGAIRARAESAAQRAGFALTLNLPAQLGEVGLEVEECVYRIADEALENAVRHAQATAVTVQLVVEGGNLVLTVIDDGQGFGWVQMPEGHFGMQGMQERAALVGGQLSVVSTPEMGTRVVVRVPVTGRQSSVAG